MLKNCVSLWIGRILRSEHSRISLLVAVLRCFDASTVAVSETFTQHIGVAATFVTVFYLLLPLQDFPGNLVLSSLPAASVNAVIAFLLTRSSTRASL